jgi:hypothetical protein
VCAGRLEDASRSGRKLPKTLLEFFVRGRVRKVRALLAGDVLSLTAALPEDATEEELHVALAYDAQGELGLDAAGHRLAAVRGDRLGLGCDRNLVLAAAFETERLERLAGDAEGEGLAFEAAGSIELAVLAAHMRRTPERRLLFLRDRTGFYAVPGTERQPFLATMLPLGLDALADPAARQRAEHARERLEILAAMPLTVVAPGSVAVLSERLAPLVGSCGEVEWVGLQELETALLPLVVSGAVGGVETVCPSIGLPPPSRDPHRNGTVLLFAVLAATLGWVGLRHRDLKADLCAVRARMQAWETLEAARQQARAESDQLRARQVALSARMALLGGKDSLPRGLQPLLATLAEHMPAYASLQSVRQRKEGGFEIAGLTYWQDGLPQLDAALRDMGLREGLRREFGGLETIEGQRAQRFRYSVVPGEVRP